VIVNFKAILDFIKDFSNLPILHEVGSYLIISETSFGGFCFEKQGLQKRTDNKNKNRIFNIEEGIC
jgi:hypothetical protein